MTRQVLLRGTILCLALSGASLAATAAPPHASHDSKHAPGVQAQLKDVDARITAARAHNTALQAQVTRMERQNATRQEQLQARDAEIAALQRQLQAAGGPASTTSTGH